MSGPNLERELEIAIELAQQAGRSILAHYRQGTAVVQRKAGYEPVTAADRAADERIRAGLRAAFPHDGLLTEESDDDLSRLTRERVWIVDPLDGTSEYLAGTGEFSVQIGLALGGAPVLGVIFQPVRGWLGYAVQGQGAYQVHQGRKARLRVSGRQDLARMCMVISRSHGTPFLESASRALGVRTLQRMGSVGLKVSLVARGECDLYVATTVTKEWDLCAPHALLSEAGGQLSDLCGVPLTYNKADVRTCSGLIASNGRAHARIVEALARLREGA